MLRAAIGGRARAASLSPKRRSEIAKAAAKARWARSRNGVLTVEGISRVVKKAVQGLGVRVILFGSYARGEATRHSDVDLLVIKKSQVKDWLREIQHIRRAMKFEQNFDVALMSEAEFRTQKNSYGLLAHEAHREGIALV